MRKILLFCFLLSTVLLFACSANAPSVEYNGNLLSEEEIFALSDRFPRESEADALTESETESAETEEPADGVVHFTDGGTVWHERLSCGHLSKKDEIRSGSIEDAIAAGKTRGCYFCTEQQETTENNDK